jgi:hypothetical protein
MVLKVPALDPAWILTTGSATGVVWGNVLDVVNALACIGTAVALFPVVRRQNEGLALAFVGLRILEAAVIFVGVASLLAVVTLRQDLAGASGAESASLLTTGHALVAVHDWANVLSPGLIPAINGLVLGTLMYRSRLVPRAIPVMGLVGGPLLLGSAAASIFGVTGQFSAVSLLLVIPIFFWELSLGTYLVVRGFRPSPVTAAMVAAPHELPADDDVAASPAGVSR